MKVNAYTKSGNKSEKKVDLIDSIWKVPMKKDVVAQVIHVYLNNQRKHSAKTKTRGEVRGGGKKPWRQKGTGRARHGSIRSPIWVGGGVAFGPTGKKRILKVPQKMRDLALKCLLSDKAEKENILVISEIEGSKNVKTKDMVKLFEKLGILDNKILVVYENELKDRESIRRGLRNLKKVQATDVNNVNSYELIKAQKLLISEKAVSDFAKRMK